MPPTDTSLAAAADFRRRLTFVALCLPVILPTAWAVNFWPFDDLVDRAQNPLGADYGVFYLPSRMVLEGRENELYSHEAQQRDLHRLFPALDQGDWLPFRYPPWVATAMTPLAALPYVPSYVLFAAGSLTALLFGLRMLTPSLTWLDGPWRNTAHAALLGWPIVWETLLGGQSSLLTTAILCATTALVGVRRFTAAGAVLALATFKPNVLAWFALGYVMRYPRLLIGAIPVGLGLIGVSAATLGWEGIVDYARLASQLAAKPWEFETDATKVQGLGSWLTCVVPGYERQVLLGCGLAAACGIAVIWRRRGDDRATAVGATGLLVLVNTLCNPYVPIYDLALLFVALAFLIEAAVLRGATFDRRRLVELQLVTAALYFGPHVSQYAYATLGMQLFPLLLLTATVWQANCWLRRSASPRAAIHGTTISDSGIRTAG